MPGSLKKKRKLANKFRTQKGCIAEAVCGGVFIILLFLGFVDMSCLVAAQYQADSVAYNVCRVAASASSSSQAQSAASRELSEIFQKSAIVTAMRVDNLSYEQQASYGQFGYVTVKTEADVNLLVPLPFLPSSIVMQQQVALPLLANLNKSDS